MAPFLADLWLQSRTEDYRRLTEKRGDVRPCGCRVDVVVFGHEKGRHPVPEEEAEGVSP